MRITTLLIPALFLVPFTLPAQTPFPLQQYGHGGCGLGDYVPTFHTGGEFPVIGNSRFQVISRNLRGGMPGVFFFAMSPAMARWYDTRILVNLFDGVGLPRQAAGVIGRAGAGESLLPLPLLNDPALVGTHLHLQGFFFDTLFPFSLAYTQRLELQVRSQISPDITALYDRNIYQKHVTDASAGKAVWQANAVAGFTYVKTQQFTCGKQSHWMVIVKDNTYGIEFVLIPGGSYRMGDIQSLGVSNERPVHWVHIEPFLLARTEVTQGQWQAVMKTAPWQGQSYVWTGTNAPLYAANWLSWNDATAFCAKVGWRLPSEAEWEYACRAGTETDYHFGENVPPTNLGNYAWYVQNAYDANQRYPHQAATKLPNAFGLHDMHGNILEWCQDRWHANYGGALTDGSAWETGSSSDRMIRGGSWRDVARYCRSSIRLRLDPVFRGHDNGSRPARSLR